PGFFMEVMSMKPAKGLLRLPWSPSMCSHLRTLP
ncbi:NR1H4 isoform 7, partial [Pongo abelii]